MWIVRLALRRRYTFVVMALLIAILGMTSIVTMPTDIFPHIDIPVVSVLWSYTGISPDEMAKRIVTVCERAMTTVVNDIEHIESQSYNGVSIIKLFFQPTAKVEMAVAQATSLVQTILRVMPPGIFPPGILKYDASSVPILQLSIGSESLRAAALRLWCELHPHPAGYGSRRCHPFPIWRQTAASTGGPRYQCPAGQRSVADGCSQRHQRPEPDSALRNF